MLFHQPQNPKPDGLLHNASSKADRPWAGMGTQATPNSELFTTTTMSTTLGKATTQSSCNSVQNTYSKTPKKP
jgi:hypothetical protein